MLVICEEEFYIFISHMAMECPIEILVSMQNLKLIPLNRSHIAPKILTNKSDWYFLLQILFCVELNIFFVFVENHVLVLQEEQLFWNYK